MEKEIRELVNCINTLKNCFREMLSYTMFPSGMGYDIDRMLDSVDQRIDDILDTGDD